MGRKNWKSKDSSEDTGKGWVKPKEARLMGTEIRPVR
jgi:hypothetical protein